MTEDGLTVEGKALGGAPIRISAPFEVLGESRNPGSLEWGKMLRFLDGDGKPHNRIVPNALMQGDPVILCSLLASEGLAIHPDHKKHLLSYLAGAQSNRRVTVVMRTGWHEIEGSKHFVLLTRRLAREGAELVVLDASAVGPYEAKGSLEDWKAGVGRMVADHFLPMLLVSTALTGPLLDLVGQDGGGIHFYGGSSIGKTTMLRVAASVWGRGSSAGGYVRGWSATRNGLEAAAASANDTVLILDELSTLDAHEAGPAIYALANGSGKSRMARDTSLRETKTWRLLVLSSGEVAMETKVAEDKRHKPRAGQAVRMLDILADRGKGFGVFSSAGSFPDAGKFADACKAEAKENYGTAGPEFVRQIFRFGLNRAETQLRDRVAAFVKAAVPRGSDGQVMRVAKLLGLIGAGGDLATELGITPWKKERATAAAKWAFQRWLAQRGAARRLKFDRPSRPVRLFIEQYGESRFDPLDLADSRPAINRAGWRRGTGSTRTMVDSAGDLEVRGLPRPRPQRGRANARRASDAEARHRWVSVRGQDRGDRRSAFTLFPCAYSTAALTKPSSRQVWRPVNPGRHLSLWDTRAACAMKGRRSGWSSRRKYGRRQGEVVLGRPRGGVRANSRAVLASAHVDAGLSECRARILHRFPIGTTDARPGKPSVEADRLFLLA